MQSVHSGSSSSVRMGRVRGRAAKSSQRPTIRKRRSQRRAPITTSATATTAAETSNGSNHAQDDHKDSDSNNSSHHQGNGSASSGQASSSFDDADLDSTPECVNAALESLNGEASAANAIRTHYRATRNSNKPRNLYYRVHTTLRRWDREWWSLPFPTGLRGEKLCNRADELIFFALARRNALRVFVACAVPYVVTCMYSYSNRADLSVMLALTAWTGVVCALIGRYVSMRAEYLTYVHLAGNFVILTLAALVMSDAKQLPNPGSSTLILAVRFALSGFFVPNFSCGAITALAELVLLSIMSVVRFSLVREEDQQDYYGQDFHVFCIVAMFGMMFMYQRVSVRAALLGHRLADIRLEAMEARRCRVLNTTFSYVSHELCTFLFQARLVADGLVVASDSLEPYLRADVAILGAALDSIHHLFTELVVSQTNNTGVASMRLREGYRAFNFGQNVVVPVNRVSLAMCAPAKSTTAASKDGVSMFSCNTDDMLCSTRYRVVGDPVKLLQAIHNLVSYLVRHAGAGAQIRANFRTKEEAWRDRKLLVNGVVPISITIECSNSTLDHADLVALYAFFESNASEDSTSAGHSSPIDTEQRNANIGIGLQVVRAVVIEQHQGAVVVEQVKPAGVRFVVTFSLRAVVEKDTLQKMTSATTRQNSNNNNSNSNNSTIETVDTSASDMDTITTSPNTPVTTIERDARSVAIRPLSHVPAPVKTGGMATTALPCVNSIETFVDDEEEECGTTEDVTVIVEAGSKVACVANDPTVGTSMVGEPPETKEDSLLSKENTDSSPSKKETKTATTTTTRAGVPAAIPTQRGSPGCNRASGAIPKSILIVDDNAMNRALVRRMLHMISQAKKPIKVASTTSPTSALLHQQQQQPLEIEIYEAENGVQALKFVAKQGRFDLIVMDKFMPVMNGDEATLKLREKGYIGQILGFSGETSPAAIAEFRSSGVNDMICKGCSRAELEAVVRKHLIST